MITSEMISYLVVIGCMAVLTPYIVKLFTYFGESLVLRFHPYKTISFIVEDEKTGRDVVLKVNVDDDSAIVKAILEAKKINSYE